MSPFSIMRVRAVSTGWAGAPGLNTFYFRSSSAEGGDPTQSDAVLAHDRVHDAFGVSLALYPPAHKTNVLPDIDVIDSRTGDLETSFAVNAGTQIVGTGQIGFAPIAIMILLRLNTNTVLDAKRIKGRAFLGPIAQSSDVDGTPDVGLTNQALAFGNKLLDGGAGDFPPLVVWHRPREASEGPPAKAFRAGGSALVENVTVPDKFAVMRSRRD